MSRYRRQIARRHRNALQVVTLMIPTKPVNGTGHSVLKMVEVSAPPATGFAFRIEYQCLVTKNWMPIAAPSARANKASDLVDECKRLAIAHCGEKMRFRIIRPLPGARAVHRIAARKTDAGEVETYSWSS